MSEEEILANTQPWGKESYKTGKRCLEKTLTHEYQKRDFLHDCGPVLDHTAYSGKFHGLKKKKENECAPRMETEKQEEERKRRKDHRKELRRQFMEEKVHHPEGYRNPITHEVYRKPTKSTITVFDEKPTGKKIYRAKGNLHDDQRHELGLAKQSKRNKAREEKLGRDGCVRQKNFSVKEFFNSYESFGY
mmetsp:Transcript_1501/g.2257  ORF Transcript_1501/g.2257 Transcript_1501/m.2257 type:complete len:190 (-) Transcript_1501:40-609(-)